MIRIRFEERENIGLQYILESLRGCSPFGSERIRRLRFYAPSCITSTAPRRPRES